MNFARVISRPARLPAPDRDKANQPGKFVQAIAAPQARVILALAHGPGFPQLLVYEILARYPLWPRQVWIDISATAPPLAGGPFGRRLTPVDEI
jgi:hypothetical protein